MKLQTTNNKSQIISNFQTPIFKFLIPVMLLALCSCQSGQVQNPPAQADAERQAKIEKALEDIKSEHFWMRREAVRILGRLGAKEHAKDIAELLKDEYTEVQSSAVNALVNLESKEYAKDIVRFLKNEDTNVRKDAVWALGEFGAKECAKDIAESLKDKDTDVRIDAVCALGWFGVKEYAKDIAGFLKDEDADIRGNAVWALGKLNAKEYATELGKLIKNAPDISDIYENRAKQKCPLCGGEQVVPIIYGLVALDDDGEELVKEGKIILGGCCPPSDTPPKWKCKKCGNEWRGITTVSSEAERVLKEWNQLPADSKQKTENKK